MCWKGYVYRKKSSTPIRIQRVNGVTEGKSSRFKVHELLVQNVQAVQSLRSVQAPSFILPRVVGRKEVGETLNTEH